MINEQSKTTTNQQQTKKSRNGTTQLQLEQKNTTGEKDGKWLHNKMINEQGKTTTNQHKTFKTMN